MRWQKERAAIARLVVGLVRITAISYFPGRPIVDTVELSLVFCSVMVGHIEDRPMTVSKLARGTGMSRATVQRRLAELVRIGYVTRSGNIYCVGPARYDAPELPRALGRIATIVRTTAKELSKLDTVS